jgi:uncharacterized protein YdeI (YjbR/CyaY-like superfamily)
MNSAILERPEPMKVPYQEKWQKETEELRRIALDCDLTEELKWGKPCFTFLKKNVAIVIPLKESCAFSFFQGALLKDPKHILERIGEHTHAGRWIKFTSPREIGARRSTLKDYLREAIEVEKFGKRLELKKPSEYPIPEELQRRLDGSAPLRRASQRSHQAGGSHTFSTSLLRSRQKPGSAGGKVCAHDPEWARVQ